METVPVHKHAHVKQDGRVVSVIKVVLSLKIIAPDALSSLSFQRSVQLRVSMATVLHHRLVRAKQDGLVVYVVSVSLP